jgi:hypothetical protein
MPGTSRPERFPGSEATAMLDIFVQKPDVDEPEPVPSDAPDAPDPDLDPKLVQLWEEVHGQNNLISRLGRLENAVSSLRVLFTQLQGQLRQLEARRR